MEKKKKRSMLPILFILPVLAVFIFSLVKIAGPLLEYRQGEKVYESLEEYVSIGEDGSYREGEMPVDFEALRKVNPDIIGWIVIPGMEISYPIVQGEDNDYYLKHTFDKAENASGCIFVEVENSPDFSDNNTFVYGHNMKNKSMFAKLNRYQEEDTFRKNPEFVIYTPEGMLRYQIYSCHVARLGTESFSYRIEGEEEFSKWLETVKSKSYYDTGVTPDISQKSVTLMTCTPAGHDYRCLVHAVLVEDSRKQP